jgi:mono/diheme cytochrome c family protein
VAIFTMAALALAQCAALASAPEPSPQDVQFFENKVRPVLVDNCYKCHSHDAPKLKGGLSLEFRELMLKGGDTGPAIVPGDPDRSLMIKAVRYTDPDLQMPPKDAKLSDQQIADLETWVRMGAPDPRTTNSAAFANLGRKSDRDHWAFKPVKMPPVPDVKDTNWVTTPVDAFILAKLEEKGMRPSPMADKRTLIRRATFDLTGLAPTLEELNAFLADDSPNAYEKVIDRLLASPQYGERWGRYWLDVARYADTKGDVKRQKEDFRYPYAWTYRDYVVRSFNEDKPYNRFLVEQIACDRVGPTNKADLAALGFLTVGPHFDDQINDIINDRIDVVTKGTMALTVTCARCHDHKFDPIPTQDYYSLHGIFASSAEPTVDPLMGPVKETPQYEDFALKYEALKKQMDDLPPFRRGMPDQNKETRRQEIQLRNQIAQLESTHPGSPPRAMVLEDKAKPADSRVFLRGEVENPGPVAPRRFLGILSGPSRPLYRNGSGRLELARDIVSTNNPLTARVMVNRIWLHHFGEGIVTTPDDFGNQSAPPSHPELLDYLAARFMQDGWSIKKMHKLIMLSSVYRQSSEDNPRYAQIDPDNRLLWRANLRRLDFEAVRDSLLGLGGRLDLTMGGHPVNLGAAPYSTRRTIYGYVDRRNLPEVYNQFDFANPDIETGRRYETIVPQQALFMMNSPLVVEQARNLVNRRDFQETQGPRERIKLLYDIIYQREPTDMEVELGLNYLVESPPPEQPEVPSRPNRGQRQGQGGQGAGAKRTPPAMSLATIPPRGLMPVGAWAKYAHALLQANEAMFIN